MKNRSTVYNTKEKAINMYLAGTKKGTICKKLHLNHKIFDKWTGGCDIKEFRKRTAFRLHKQGKLEEYICKKLGIGSEKLKQWIATGYEKERVELNKYRIENQFKEYKNGRSPWVTQIIKNAVNSRQVRH